jgi:hypothetical protein
MRHLPLWLPSQLHYARAIALLDGARDLRMNCPFESMPGSHQLLDEPSLPVSSRSLTYTLTQSPNLAAPSPLPGLRGHGGARPRIAGSKRRIQFAFLSQARVPGGDKLAKGMLDRNTSPALQSDAVIGVRHELRRQILAHGAGSQRQADNSRGARNTDLDGMRGGIRAGARKCRFCLEMLEEI